jgi:methionine biosynthesis protein MetW
MSDDIGPIGAWITPKSRLLDLGCGDGDLLRTLIDDYQVQGYGLEIDPDSINQCIRKGLNVIEQDLNGG